jgi:hypothetical protein
MRRFGFLLFVSLIVVIPLLAAAPPELPKVTVVAPLGIAPGVKTRLTIRGLRLDSATEVRCQEPKATAKLLTKSKVGVPNPQDLDQLGDKQVEAEVTLPPDYPNRTVTVSVVTPAGESRAHELLVERAPVLDEKEPNNGFRQAQTIALPQEVQGRIDPAKDVDLFRFKGKAGQRLTIEVFAARYGSPLDALLTLYDDAGHILASCDDSGDSADPRLEVTLPKDGMYCVGVSDANDQGGATYLYRLSVRVKKR